MRVLKHAVIVLGNLDFMTIHRMTNRLKLSYGGILSVQDKAMLTQCWDTFLKHLVLQAFFRVGHSAENIRTWKKHFWNGSCSSTSSFTQRPTRWFQGATQARAWRQLLSPTFAYWYSETYKYWSQRCHTVIVMLSRDWWILPPRRFLILFESHLCECPSPPPMAMNGTKIII